MPDLGGADTARLQIFDQRNVGRGATDVKRQDILDSGIFAHPERSGNPTCRTGHQDVNRMLFRLLRRHQAAVRTEQREFSGKA